MKVLFIGNSHTYMNDMPALFAELMKETAKEETEAVMLAYSGRSLSWHRAEYFSIRYQLLYGGFDYCVIQQAAHPFPDVSETMQAGKELTDLCLKCGVKPVLFMTWAEKAYPEHQKIMSDTYRKLAEETGALLAPVGEVFEKVSFKYPEIELYYKDGEHASVLGDFLAASVITAVLSGTDQIECPPVLPDYGVNFDDPQHPYALLDKHKIFRKADRESAEKILSVIREGGYCNDLQKM